MENGEMIQALAIQFGTELSGDDHTAARLQLIARINWLILHDFERLVNTLYRIDVSEKKINALLKDFPQTDAAAIIAELVIRREEEKYRSRQQFRSNDDNGQEERW
ncbi:MAG: hypothetical protein EOO88_60375 [Pedobacter sp.]|nr:MAG: hypothetical protein EOO88_60375 [Pedobacter sp.]